MRCVDLGSGIRRPALACLATAAALLVACATPSDGPAPGLGHVHGRLDLVPPPAAAGGGGTGAYGDRRLRGARRVDYSTPGFAVVYLDHGRVDDATPVTLTIRDGRVSAASIDPRHAALPAGGHVLIANRSRSAHVVSCPSLGVMTQVPAGASTDVLLEAAGEHACHVLDAADASVRLFASPGPYSQVDRDGRFEINDVVPGDYTVRVWHPRFAPISRPLRIAAGVADPLVLELGPGAAKGPADDAR